MPTSFGKIFNKNVPGGRTGCGALRKTVLCCVCILLGCFWVWR